ncbi:MAG: D-alanyl-D-alanine carboxypeptidase, partial [Planctomycetes bacterium]|nr:D-alanyl-D-alanine carboxypeptidase [Planctomycetota bacterium]
MKPPSRLPICLLAILCWQFISPANTPGGELDDEIAAIMKRPLFKGSSFGILVTELKGGRIVYSHRPLALQAPASTTKLVSCAGALGLLGKDFRFHTRVIRTGELENGVVNGDLVLIASGDPNLSQRPDKNDRLRFVDRDHSYAGFSEADLVAGDPLQVLRKLADDVAGKGVREIKGDVVVDDGLFKETTDSFVGRFSAICINDNLVDFTIRPGGKPGDKAVASWRPNLSPVKVRIQARTVEAGGVRRLWVETRDGPASFIVKGTIPADSGPTVRVGKFATPAISAAHLFAALLEHEGVKINGERQHAVF